ncbi:hypothetical protein FVEN_g2214 [Fusarium venenatum]|uniref:Vacuolar iron transporter Ccc1 n=1 Tax=Fusarium venenatum TaxID=56646 RepID=A0A2L2T3W7_9HYPO|nr:uncharacterized protein FVRRES_12640 [Fusarium venenatum]KAG8360450.1 hypothetical protein FVEN_g2214 [Fusarium venenatum]KAH6979233.1 Ccc1 family [Fusarium venenatum]CEI39949.1 unnamed protein product [Fusarium venenatum]
MKLIKISNLKRFFSDFTLGFSDGLTVPFALTAGLSSLGKADTVITGGLAELCAGSISMGIGGYLAARDEYFPCRSTLLDEESPRDHGGTDEASETDCMVEQSEKMQARLDDLVRRHLEPLDLSVSTITTVLDSIQREPKNLRHTISKLESYTDNTSLHTISLTPSPIISGLTISLGYAVGGIIPLLPYFFASTVGMGLRLSSILCLMVLFTFGAGKRWILSSDREKIISCLVEGLQMLVLGAMAAGAAVLCVTWVADR